MDNIANRDRVERWRAKAHYWALIASNGGRKRHPDTATVETAAALASMYLALAMDAAHFGELPKPDFDRGEHDDEL